MIRPLGDKIGFARWDRPLTTVDYIFLALEQFILTEPGFRQKDYGVGRKAYNRYHADLAVASRGRARALKQLRIAMALPAEEEALLAAFRSAYQGRLEWTGKTVTFTPREVFGVEYRQAVAEVLAYYIRFHPVSASSAMLREVRKKLGEVGQAAGLANSSILHTPKREHPSLTKVHWLGVGGCRRVDGRRSNVPEEITCRMCCRRLRLNVK